MVADWRRYHHYAVDEEQCDNERPYNQPLHTVRNFNARAAMDGVQDDKGRWYHPGKSEGGIGSRPSACHCEPTPEQVGAYFGSCRTALCAGIQDGNRTSSLHGYASVAWRTVAAH